MNNSKFIGGFFQMALPDLCLRKSMAEHWNLPNDPELRFTNARSALAALISSLQPKRIWVPAYICHLVIDAFSENNIETAYYSVGEMLEPNICELDEKAHSGEVVLAVNYFGCVPPKRFLDFVNRRSDLMFIEDGAQTIDNGYGQWGDWHLISPRKVVGVADGGFIIPTKSDPKNVIKSSTPNLKENEYWSAPLLRFNDTGEVDNSIWHNANQLRESSMKVSYSRMSDLSHALLKHIDVNRIIEKRKSNFKVLYEKLSSISFFSVAVPDFCPFGFPIRLKSSLRSILKKEMHEIGYFPAVHWDDLPSPKNKFENEHRLSQELLTLPCDQRYNTSDMFNMAHAVLKIIRKYI